MATADDAGVYLLDDERALVLTVDYFTPIVDDPRAYGQIAAANSLSDVFAMGGRPLTALNVLGMPEGVLPVQVVNSILRGGAAKATEARCAIVGGHTIKNPEPFYGLSVTGLVHPDRIVTNANARPGDVILLTKPLGTGIVTTGIKQGTCPPALARAAVTAMRALNIVGAELAERRLVRAGTDVTGFGLLGHLGAICRASGVGANLDASRLPVVGPGVWKLIAEDCVPGGTRANLQTAEEFTVFSPDISEAQKLLMADAQTSGGLLLCVPETNLHAVRRELRRQRTLAEAVLGVVVRSSRPVIQVRVG